MDKQVLIIENEPSVSAALVQIFTYAGYVATVAKTFAETLTIVSRLKFDLITLDMRLGDKSGNEVMEELQKRNVTTPVLVITATPEDVDQTLHFKALITKPFKIQQLLSTLQQLVTSSI